MQTSAKAADIIIIYMELPKPNGVLPLRHPNIQKNFTTIRRQNLYNCLYPAMVEVHFLKLLDLHRDLDNHNNNTNICMVHTVSIRAESEVPRHQNLIICC